jgi:hypothetical protein
MYRVNVGSDGGALGGASAVYQLLTSIAGTTTFTASCLARAVSGTVPVRISFYTGADHVGSADITLTTTPQLLPITAATAAGGPHTCSIAIRAATAGGVVGDIEVGGFQLETGSRASSPILTLGATATRAADALVVPGSGWISSTQGTLAADYVPSAAGTQLIVELDDATANERHSLTNDGIFTVVDGGVSQASVDGGTPTVAARNKIAASYAVDAFAVALNGGAVVTDTSGTLPTVNRMDVNALNGHLTRIRYIGRRLSDGQLRALTE